ARAKYSLSPIFMQWASRTVSYTGSQLLPFQHLFAGRQRRIYLERNRFRNFHYRGLSDICRLSLLPNLDTHRLQIDSLTCIHKCTSDLRISTFYWVWVQNFIKGIDISFG